MLKSVVSDRFAFSIQGEKSEKETSQEKNIVKSRQNSHANINISEVLMQSSIWKCIDQQSQKTTKNFKQAVKW